MNAHAEIWESIERVTTRTRPMVLSVSDFARLMSVSRVSVYRMVNEGDVRSIQLLGTKRIPVSEVFRLLGGETEVG